MIKQRDSLAHLLISFNTVSRLYCYTTQKSAWCVPHENRLLFSIIMNAYVHVYAFPGLFCMLKHHVAQISFVFWDFVFLNDFFAHHSMRSVLAAAKYINLHQNTKRHCSVVNALGKQRLEKHNSLVVTVLSLAIVWRTNYTISQELWKNEWMNSITASYANRTYLL